MSDSVTYARPERPRRPCPGCGALVEPLRAPRVLLLEDGFRFLCSDACGERVLERANAPDAPPPAAPPRPAPQALNAATAHERDTELVDLRDDATVSSDARRGSAFRLLAGAGLVGAVLAPFAESAFALALSSLCAIAAAVVPLFLVRDRTARLALAPASLGVALAIIAALTDRAHGPSWMLFAANVAAALGVLRVALDDHAESRLAAVVRGLLDRIPASVRVPDPLSEEPLKSLNEKRSTGRLRAGEEVLVFEGETAGVDGIVRAGEARVLLHPSAEIPVRRGAGDPILAGARVLDGAVRVLATRVGDERALARPSRFAQHSERETARLTSIALLLTRFGPLVLAAVAAAACALTDEGGLSGRLAAGAAVLLGAPLLSMRRSVEAPFVAAAAAAVARGIVFESSRALDRAGRATRTVLCTHGTITEGKPSVVEFHALDSASEDELIALAAASEAAAEDHPIALAVQQFARARGVAPEGVRRATFLRGRGVTSLAPGGEPFVFGSRQLLLDEGVSVAVVDDEALRAEARGRTIVFVGFGGRVRGLVSLADPMRSGARAAVQRIMDLGSEVVLISGDHRGTVEALARKLDIDHVKAELLASEQGTEVERLRDAGGPVAVVGTAPQDESALLAADVPVVLSASGDLAGERGISLATEDLRDAAIGLWVAHAARHVAARSLVLAGTTALVLSVAASLGFAGPLLAAIAAFTVDAFVVPSGTRLLHRIDRRVPSRNS